MYKYLQYEAKFEIVFKLAILLSKLLISSQMENVSEINELNSTREWNLTITEINFTDRKEFAVDNYSFVNMSLSPLSNDTLITNDTFFQDDNITYPSNFSSEENVTYKSVIDETRAPERPSLPCNCDLIGDGCDVNCCCDKDCTDRDRDAFYGCIPPPISISERHCISKTIIYDHTKIKEKTVEQDDLFCIIHDHLKERHEYLEPPVLATVTDFQKFVPKPSYSWISISEPVNSGIEHIHEVKAGESLYILTVDDVITEWKLPTSIFSGHCGSFKAAKYMIDEKATCEQVIKDLEEACLHNKWLKATTFYKNFSLVTSDGNTETNSTSPGLENNSNFHCAFDLLCIPIIPSHNSTCWDNGIPHRCENIPLPQYDAANNICKNVVSKVHYSIIHDGSAGFKKVNVEFEVITVNNSQRAVSQHYSVCYYGTNSKYVFRRSGNPGYLIGYPILAGIITENDYPSPAILLSSDRKNWLTVMGKTTNSYCSESNSDRLPVKFGENLNTGCLYEVPYLKENVIHCSYIQERVMDILNINNAPSHVGMFGNSDVHNIADWIKIQHEGKPTEPYADATSEGGCSSIVLGVDIKIAYANTGSLVNPQPKIIGVLYEYLMPEYIQPPCVGPSCNARVTHTVQLKTSVTFIDASRAAFPMYAQVPVTKISFPHDFFYPLISGYSGSHIGITLLDWSFYIVLACLITGFEKNV